MKKTNNIVRKIVFILVMVFSAAVMIFPAAAQIGEWEIKHYFKDGKEMENYYLSADVDGVAAYEDGSTEYAFMRLYVDRGIISFVIGPSYENRLVNNSEKRLTNTLVFSTNMGISDSAIIYMNPGSTESFFDSGTEYMGMSVNDLILQDMMVHGCEIFKIPIPSYGNHGENAILEFYMPFYQSDFPDLYRQAEKDGWKEPLEIETESQVYPDLPGIADQIDRISADIFVNYKANEIFSTYDADMYVDGELVKTLSQGTSTKVTVHVTPGEKHTVSFFKHGDTSLHDQNRHIFTFTLNNDGAIECSIAAHWYGMIVKETKLK